MPFQIIRNDICRVKADAIVNTANPGITYGRGTDRAIYEAAGVTELLAARRQIGEIAPGDAAVTPGFRLPARYIIHAVGPEWHGGNAGEEELLASCYRRALALAEKMGCRSVAFPLISAGVYGFPKDLALQIARREIRTFLENSELEVLLVVYDPEVFALSQGLQERVRQYIDDHYVELRRMNQASGPMPSGGGAPGSASAAPSGYASSAGAGNAPFSAAGKTSSAASGKVPGEYFARTPSGSMPGKPPQTAPRRPASASRPPEAGGEPEMRRERRRPLRDLAQRAREELERRKRREEDLAQEEELCQTDFLADYAAEEDGVCAPPEPEPRKPQKAAAGTLAAAAPEVPAPAVSSRKQRELSEIMAHVGETFRECLMRYIDERNLTDAYVYKRANIDRKLFSKIRCSEDYMPRKRTVVALAFALELSLDETVDLLRKAGMALAPGNRFDLIIRFCLENEIYDLYEVNVLLFMYKQPLLGC